MDHRETPFDSNPKNKNLFDKRKCDWKWGLNEIAKITIILIYQYLLTTFNNCTKLLTINLNCDFFNKALIKREQKINIINIQYIRIIQNYELSNIQC